MKCNTSNNQRLANAGEDFFAHILGLKDLEAYREMPGDFVCPWATPKVLIVFPPFWQ